MTEMRRIHQILVVDDEPDIRAFLEITLAINDYDVVLAEDGFQGEALARQLQPDLIILDVMMPGRDGIAVLQALRQDEATRDIPVLMLTARCGDEDVWSGWESGANYYLTKPFDVDDLLRFVESLSAVEPLVA